MSFAVKEGAEQTQNNHSRQVLPTLNIPYVNASIRSNMTRFLADFVFLVLQWLFTDQSMA